MHGHIGRYTISLRHGCFRFNSHSSEFQIIVVTNQGGIALGEVRLEGLEEVYRRMTARFSKYGAIVTDVYLCPHNISEHCSCWKPKSSMLLQAAEDHALDLFPPWMIGDTASDIEVGKKAGCKTGWILPVLCIAED